MSDILLQGLYFKPDVLIQNENAKYSPNEQYFPNLNIGGGLSIYPNWTNLDFNFGVFVNEAALGKIQDNSLTAVYASHFFEHVPQATAFKLFEHIYRSLSSTGVFRLSCPDIDLFVQQFSYEEKYQKQWWDSVWPGHPETLSPRDLFAYMGGNTKMENVPDLHVGHVWPQSFGVVFWMLTIAGFDPSKIKRSSYGESKISDISKYKMDNRSNHSFYIEATK